MPKKVSALVGYQGNTKQIEYDVPDNEPGVWGADREFSVAGVKDVPRLDALEKVTGKAKYTYDISRPNMLHAVLVTCPFAHARIEKIDFSEAKKMPGVRAIELFDGVEGGKALCAGWLIAAVAAETIQQARDAARMVKIDYKELPFVYDYESSLDKDAPKIHDGGNVSKPSVQTRGDIEKGFQEADIVHEATYTTQVQTHSCLEVHGCLAEWNGDELTVWHSTQGVWGVAQDLAKAFAKEGLTESKSRCITQYMGGGFGSKFGAEDFGILCARMAKKLRRPVKMMMDRTLDSVMMGNKPQAKMTVKLGVKRDGTLTAIQLDSLILTGHSGSDSVAVPFLEHYDCPNVKITERNVYINAGESRAFRAPGRPQGSFGLEMALEELAGKLEMNPYDLRARNLSGNLYKALPYEFELGGQRSDYKKKYQKPGSQTGRFRRGIGCGVTFWRNVGWPGGSVVRCALHPDGSVEFACGVQDIGTGTRTMMAITGAEELGIGTGLISILIGDTRLGLPGPASGGSSTAPCTAPAVRSAAYKAKMNLFNRVADTWKTKVDDIDCKDGTVFSKSDSNKKMPWREACSSLDNLIVTIGEYVNPPDVPGCGTGVWGAQFAEVEVDTHTGKVKVLKVTAVQDCGKTIAKKQAEGQIASAVVQGVTSALFEERVMDNVAGRQLNPNMEHYKILNVMDVPDVEPVVVDVFDPVNAASVKGLGEPPYIPTAAAIGCAVANAIGVPVRELPITPDKVLAALAGKEG